MSKHWTPAKTELHHGIRGLHIDDVSDDTKPITGHLQTEITEEVPLVTPIYHTSTYKMPTVDHYLKILQEKGYVYGRLGNPTCRAAEAAISSLEGGAGCVVFASGMAAISITLLSVLKAGDHVVICNPVYSGTHKFVGKYLCQYNIDCSFVTTDVSVEEYKEKIKPNTKLLYGETPCNPLVTVMDLKAFGKLGQSLGLLTMIDSTYASSYLQQPHKYGIDIVVHSATKYLGGHSDVTAGVASLNSEELWNKVNTWKTTLGAVLSPFEASLLQRGVKTLPLRMQKHSTNAQKVAEFLQSQPKVSQVYYPGLPNHPGHQVAKKQMKMFGGMMAFEMKGGLKAAKILVENVRVIQLAVSLGGVDSLIEHPATMTHGPMIMSDAERAEALISDGLIRLSIGIEDPDDLVKDLEYALDKVL